MIDRYAGAIDGSRLAGQDVLGKRPRGRPAARATAQRVTLRDLPVPACVSITATPAGSW
jgi:hypothetical protein